MCVFYADSSGPSSTVSSAGPSSPITADTSPRFSFSEKAALTPQSSEEIHSSSHVAGQPAPPSSSCLPESPPSDPQPQSPDRPNDVTMDSTASSDSPLPKCEQATEAQSTTEAETDPSSDQVELSLAMESFSNLPESVTVSVPGSLPVLLELRESSSEAGSSTQTPLSPDEPEEFFNTQETVEVGLTSMPFDA